MRISEEKIAEVKSVANILTVVEKYVVLKKAGKNYKGCCPFHSEKTPSFVVSPDKQMYHCFGCHAGGDSIKFMMEYHNLTYVEAIQQLADEYGVVLETEDSPKDGKQNEKESAFDMMRAVAKYYHEVLNSPDKGKPGLTYFMNRDLAIKSLRSFGLGYSQPEWQALTDYLSKNGYDLPLAEKLGLIGSKNNRYYDKLRGRVIFPIFSHSGRVIAIAGRKLDGTEDEGPKYINSPESVIYHKGKVLYGLSHAKDEIRQKDYVVLVEGYLDVITLHQAGIKNVVAVSGTALTEDQVLLITRYTRNVYLIFDSDNAGVKASLRSIEILLRKGIAIKVVELPASEDPDSFVRKNGAEVFYNKLETAQGFLEYQTGYYQKTGKLTDPESSAEVIRDLVKLIALIEDTIKQQLYMRQLSEKFKIRYEILEEELLKILPSKALPSPKSQIAQKVSTVPSETQVIKIPEHEYLNEMALIRLLYSGEREVIEFILLHVRMEEFLDPDAAKLFEVMYESFNNTLDYTPDAVLAKINDEDLMNKVRPLIMANYFPSENVKKFSDADIQRMIHKETIETVKKFKLQKLREERKMIVRDIVESERSGQNPVLLMQEIISIDGEIKRIIEEYDSFNK